jgi:hypothetical protein
MNNCNMKGKYQRKRKRNYRGCRSIWQAQCAHNGAGEKQSRWSPLYSINLLEPMNKWKCLGLFWACFTVNAIGPRSDWWGSGYVTRPSEERRPDSQTTRILYRDQKAPPLHLPVTTRRLGWVGDRPLSAWVWQLRPQGQSVLGIVSWSWNNAERVSDQSCCCVTLWNVEKDVSFRYVYYVSGFDLCSLAY